MAGGRLVCFQEPTETYSGITERRSVLRRKFNFLPRSTARLCRATGSVQAAGLVLLGHLAQSVTKLLEIKPLELPAAPKQPPAGPVSVNTAVALPGGSPAPGKHAEQRFQHLDFKINPWKQQACWHFQRRPPAFLIHIYICKLTVPKYHFTSIHRRAHLSSAPI